MFFFPIALDLSTGLRSAYSEELFSASTKEGLKSSFASVDMLLQIRRQLAFITCRSREISFPDNYHLGIVVAL